ncbi:MULTISPECIES: hypothetical protein [Methylomonas]|uniref:Peptidase C-terminal archaeal/bacterial domain-containing protein n=1 Tax=Methylomonas methanica TaxID=421 RepID=A0ABY2CJ66_METMH|nr:MULTISPECIES: hypothetical protein [Methylomonas]TCV81034.1 hypothetical protein EDE11_11783 [Methylomonas methanica]
MNKYLTIICLTIASFQVNASTLTWNTITGYGPTLGSLQSGQYTPQDLFGIITDLYIETNVLDDWTFSLHSTSQVRVTANSLETNTGSLLYGVNLDGNRLDKTGGSANESWLFDNILTAGSHAINVIGIATSLDHTSGYQINVSATNTVVPVPEIGWTLSFFLFYIFHHKRGRVGRSFCAHTS